MRSTVSATEAVQAPLALASALAVITRRWPRSITASRQMSSRSARTQRAPVRMSAPRSAASTALAITSREIVHHAIGIFERGAERPLQRVADRMMGDVDRRGSRQAACAAPAGRRATARTAAARTDARRNGRGSRSASGAPDAARSAARRRARPAPADAQQAAPLQHRKIAMDQPRCRRRCGGAEVALLEQNDPQAATGGVARHADAVQAAADDRKVVVRHAQAIALSGDAG